MQEYTFDLINARFIASGIAVQAKGTAYRLRPNIARDAMRLEDYPFSGSRGLTMRSNTNSNGNQINSSEEQLNNSSDYWLGRTALTDLLVKVPGEGDLLINDVAMNISLQKEVVKTALVGRVGTIKEYISNGDYQISMSVGIVAVNDSDEIIDQYPERAVAQLREILERPDSIEVNSAFLDLFEINNIVVTGFSVKQMTFSNRQVIEITALSDDDYHISSVEY